ncbi:hypothetical protein H0H87_010932 [Tephrocybe sp. NHM501043]|nr:hypothetical protein H0H87_010932 [Tephrocybe sp. NHM501043]
MTDGACSNNSRYSATSGLGVVIGADGAENHQWSIPVNCRLDGHAPRIRQRTELLAALEDLKKLHKAYEKYPPYNGHGYEMVDDHGSSRPTLVVATDSEYVVKGMSEWFPNWRNNGCRNRRGQTPANLDLFCKLDDLVTELEQDGFDVGFWHIYRRFNYWADGLAKDAARY